MPENVPKVVSTSVLCGDKDILKKWQPVVVAAKCHYLDHVILAFQHDNLGYSELAKDRRGLDRESMARCAAAGKSSSTRVADCDD
jgi:hypothetical protein